MSNNDDRRQNFHSLSRLRERVGVRATVVIFTGLAAMTLASAQAPPPPGAPAAQPQPSFAALSPASVATDKAIEFPAPDGKSVTLEPGSYLVVAEPAGGLRLTAASGKTFVLAATAATHAEQISKAQAVIVAVGDNERHLVLLLPGAKRLEAIGSVGGIRSRGLARPQAVSSAALQAAVVSAQPPATMAPAALMAAATTAPATTTTNAVIGPVVAAPVQVAPGTKLVRDPGLRPKMPMPPVPAPYTGLTGWADLHVHPMIHLAFAGKLVFGAPDVQSLLPTNHSCVPWAPAGTVQEALGDDRPSHGGWDMFNFRCGDEFRVNIINQLQSHNTGALVTAGPGRAPALGYPNFQTWPAWNDISHQKMWWEWIKRARDGGQRVMVALVTNNRTLGDSVAGPGDGPTDDAAQTNLQIGQMKAFVARHQDFMQIAYTPAELESIVRSNRIAVVLGVEIDNIGNLSESNIGAYGANAYGAIVGAIQGLYAQGVRYIFPVHVVDNLIGGTAIYQPMFNLANFRETGHFWRVECSVPGDDIQFIYAGGFDPVSIAAMVKIGFDPRNQPPLSPLCTARGSRNSAGLTGFGAMAIKEMMRRGMIIDIDHMSHRAVEETLGIAVVNNYPVNSGHSGIRGVSGNAENSRSKAQLLTIAKLGGMFGLGTDGVPGYTWSRQYQSAMNYMGYMRPENVYQNGAIAFGSDLNGLVKGPPPINTTSHSITYDNNFQKSSFPGTTKSWDYNTEGVAHYGMLPDFLRDVYGSPADANLGRSPTGQPYGVTGADLVDNHMNRSADYFWRMWVKCETQKANIR